MKPSFWLRRNFVFETPMAVVTIPERGHGGTHLFDVLEDTAVNGLCQGKIEMSGSWAR
jgi:hypothetical protein